MRPVKQIWEMIPRLSRCDFYLRILSCKLLVFGLYIGHDFILLFIISWEYHILLQYLFSTIYFKNDKKSSQQEVNEIRKCLKENDPSNIFSPQGCVILAFLKLDVMILGTQYTHPYNCGELCKTLQIKSIQFIIHNI